MKKTFAKGIKYQMIWNMFSLFFKITSTLKTSSTLDIGCIFRVAACIHWAQVPFITVKHETWSMVNFWDGFSASIVNTDRCAVWDGVEKTVISMISNLRIPGDFITSDIWNINRISWI